MVIYIYIHYVFTKFVQSCLVELILTKHIVPRDLQCCVLLLIVSRYITMLTGCL